MGLRFGTTQTRIGITNPFGILSGNRRGGQFRRFSGNNGSVRFARPDASPGGNEERAGEGSPARLGEKHEEPCITR